MNISGVNNCRGGNPYETSQVLFKRRARIDCRVLTKSIAEVYNAGDPVMPDSEFPIYPANTSTNCRTPCLEHSPLTSDTTHWRCCRINIHSLAVEREPANGSNKRSHCLEYLSISVSRTEKHFCSGWSQKGQLLFHTLSLYNFSLVFRRGMLSTVFVHTEE